MSEYIYEHKPSGADHMGKPVELPTLVQREEIVRCRDCEHYENTGNCHYWASYEPIPGGDEYMEMLAEVTDDGFCAWGVREEGRT